MRYVLANIRLSLQDLKLLVNECSLENSICHFIWDLTSTGTSTRDGKRHGAASPPETELVAKHEREGAEDAPACLALQDIGHSTPWTEK